MLLITYARHMAIMALFIPTSAIAQAPVEELLAVQAHKFEEALKAQSKLIAAQAKRLDELEAQLQRVDRVHDQASIANCDSVWACVDSRAGMNSCRAFCPSGLGNITCGTR